MKKKNSIKSTTYIKLCIRLRNRLHAIHSEMSGPLLREWIARGIPPLKRTNNLKGLQLSLQKERESPVTRPGKGSDLKTSSLTLTQV